MAQYITVRLVTAGDTHFSSTTYTLSVSEGTIQLAGGGSVTGLTKSQLDTGVDVELSSDTVSIITATVDNGLCTGASDNATWLLPTATPTPEPTATAIPTATPLAATATPSPTAEPTATPLGATATPSPTATPTQTPEPGAATATPSPTPTSGPEPATATPSPTPTSGPEPATATPSPTPTSGPAEATATPTPTATVSYNYYFAEPCEGGTTIYIRSTSTLSSGEVFKLAGDSTCYVVGESGAPINSNDPIETFPDCSACSPVTATPTPPPAGATATPTPTPGFNYYFAEECQPGTDDRVVRTTATLTPDLDPQLADAYDFFGTCYFIKSTATQNDYDTNAGNLPSVDITGETIVSGCNACQGATPTPTPTSTPRFEFTVSYLENGGDTDPTNTCSAFLQYPIWSEESSDLATAVQIGSAFWDSETGNSGYAGDFKWYGIGTTSDFSPVYRIRLSSAGLVTDVVSCF